MRRLMERHWISPLERRDDLDVADFLWGRDPKGG